MNYLSTMKKSRLSFVGGIALAIVALMAMMIYTSKVYATEDFWEVKAGDKTLAIVNSESSAKKVVEGVKNHYVAQGAKVEDIKVNPELKTVQKNIRVQNAPKTDSIDDAVKRIVTGEVEKRVYTIKEGDTLWDIAANNSLTIEGLTALNPGKDLELILPGDTVNLNENKPFVKVQVTQVITSQETIAPENTYEDTSDLYKDQEEVKEQGAEGSKEVTLRQVAVNGAVTTSEGISEKIIKEAKPTIIRRGTASRPVAASTSSRSSSSSRSYGDASTYSGSGSSIASFACQFVGNPYAYGGTSLTNGADCSGFIYAVYRSFGISLPRVPFGVGRSVSTSAMAPGDIIVYPGHFTIYIGGGQEVHAVNESMGIAITSIGYSMTGPIIDVRRVVE